MLIDHEYAGCLSPEKILPELDRRRPVTATMMRTGRRGWSAFTSSDPRELGRFLDSATAELPALRPMLKLIGEEYPDRNGLSRIERKLLLKFRRRRASVLVVTDFGQKVLSTRADAIAFNGIDRWIGGVHLRDEPPRR